MMDQTFKRILLTAVLLIVAISCAKKAEDDDAAQDNESYVIQTAVLQVGAIANASEPPVTVGMQSTSIQPMTQQPFAVCNYTSFPCPANTNVKTIDWNACTAKSSTLTGGWFETYNSNPCCGSFASGCNVTRTTFTNGSVITFSNNATLTTSSESHTNYLGTVIPGNLGVNVSLSGLVRTININGLHRILKGSKGTVWFDHSIRTSSNVTVSGSRSVPNRTITGGAVTVDHNLAKYTATTTFSAATPLTWADPSCCYPSSGTVSTTYSNKTGTATLTFTGGACGVASMTDTVGSTTSIIMSPCD